MSFAPVALSQTDSPFTPTPLAIIRQASSRLAVAFGEGGAEAAENAEGAEFGLLEFFCVPSRPLCLLR